MPLVVLAVAETVTGEETVVPFTGDVWVIVTVPATAGWLPKVRAMNKSARKDNSGADVDPAVRQPRNWHDEFAYIPAPVSVVPGPFTGSGNTDTGTAPPPTSLPVIGKILVKFAENPARA